MNEITLAHFLCLSAAMFFIGFAGIVFKRNLIGVMMSIELMLNAANVAFAGASFATNSIDGQIMILFVMTVAACEAAVGLAMVIALYRKHGTLETDFLRILRG